MTTESPVNNPTHPCQFCAEPVPAGGDYCSRTCFTADEIWKVFLQFEDEYIDGWRIIKVGGPESGFVCPESDKWKKWDDVLRAFLDTTEDVCGEKVA